VFKDTDTWDSVMFKEAIEKFLMKRIKSSDPLSNMKSFAPAKKSSEELFLGAEYIMDKAESIQKKRYRNTFDSR
jgi:hypothetical protein